MPASRRLDTALRAAFYRHHTALALHTTVNEQLQIAAIQFGRSSGTAFTGSDLESDAYQAAEKAKKLALEVTSLAGQLQTARKGKRRRPIVPLVRRP